MAQPSIRVQHFIGCLNAPWEGPAGPNIARTLEGVSLQYGVPPDAEPWFDFPEYWLYARIFRTSNREGERTFSLRVIWNDSPNGPRTIYNKRLERVRFRHTNPNRNIAWALRPMSFPGLGLFEFRLRVRERDVLGIRWRIVAREFIWIVRSP